MNIATDYLFIILVAALCSLSVSPVLKLLEYLDEKFK